MDNQNRKLELLGNAPIPKALLAMGIPTMIGMLINALYNLVDAYFVGGFIYIVSCIFNVFNVTMNNIVTSEGAAKTTMCALLLGAILNIGLDPLFIYTFNFGVAGAAIATAISQVVSTLVYLLFQLLTSISISLINNAAGNYGDSAIAGMGVVTRLISMGSLTVFGFIKGFQPIAGYSYGAKKNLIVCVLQSKFPSYGQLFSV